MNGPWPDSAIGPGTIRSLPHDSTMTAVRLWREAGTKKSQWQLRFQNQLVLVECAENRVRATRRQCGCWTTAAALRAAR